MPPAEPSTTTLLERLRQSPPVRDRNLMGLCLERVSEFPVRLRGAIREAARAVPEAYRASSPPSSLVHWELLLCLEQHHAPAEFPGHHHHQPLEPTPDEFFSEVYDALKALLFHELGSNSHHTTRHLVVEPNNHNSGSHHGWNGLDRQTDTEDQVEVAVRVFPHILRERVAWMRFPYPHWKTPIDCLEESFEALPFLPLLAELGYELGIFDETKARHFLWRPFFIARERNWLLRRYRDRGIAPGDNFARHQDQTTLALMARVKESRLKWIPSIDLLMASDVYGSPILSYVRGRTSVSDALVEQRVRLLIDWNPRILKDCTHRGYGHPLLHFFLSQWWVARRHHPEQLAEKLDDLWIRFQKIVEIGMAYYSEEIGFLFHCFGPMPYKTPSPTFREACALFGTERVLELVDRVMVHRALGQTGVFPKLVCAAASQASIARDALFLFLRRAPVTEMGFVRRIRPNDSGAGPA